jgi:outer membrane protein TolC
MNRRLTRIAFALLFAGLMAAAPAHAGYRDMLKNLESYRPPAPVLDGAKSEGTDPARMDMDAAQPDESATTLRKSRMDRDAATAGENGRPSEATFYQPSADRMERLGPAADDPAAAASTLEGTFSLPDLETLALLRNPGVQAAKAEHQAVLAQFSQIERVDAVLGRYAAFTESLMTGVGPMTGMSREITNQFPSPGVTSLKGQAVDAAARAAQEGLSAARMDAVTGVRKIFWNLRFIGRARQIEAETMDLLDQLEAAADSLYRSGKTSFQDVVRITIRRKRLAEEIVTLRERERNLEARLLQLLDLPPETAVGRPETRQPERKLPKLESLYALARENRPELRRIRANIERMARMVEMGETMSRPSLSLDLSAYSDNAALQVGSQAMRPTFPEKTMASMGAGAPQKPFFGGREAWLEETKLRLAAMEERLKAMESMTEREVRDAWFELDRAIREARLFSETVVDLSRSALEVSSRGYESGSVPFASVIGAYTDWLDARLGEARKESDIGVARAELARVVGAGLP